jgi:large subunit ribosomal protein L10
MTSHDRKWKEAKLAEIKKLSEEYPVIAVATLNELPANIMSLVRKRLGDDAVVVVAKTRVVKKAFEESSVDTSKIDDLVKESVAVIFSKKNPFELFSFIKKNKGAATAKEGDVADDDIVVQAGDTGLPPGPALSGLKAAGLKVAVQGPTISVTADKVVTKKGEEVNAAVADVLSKLNMKPMKIGMSVLGVLDKSENEFYSADVLDVDEEELFNNFITAYQHALNLSVETEFYTDQNVELIVVKAERSAKAINDEVGNAEEAPAEEKKDEAKEETTENKEENSAEESKEKVAEEEASDIAEQTEKSVDNESASEEKKDEAQDDTSKNEENDSEVDKEAEEVAEQSTEEDKKKEN